MPLYEYKCDKCGNVFEVIQKFSDTPLTEHAGCGGKVEKLLSASAFSLKGSGWYATDYARPGSKSDKSEAKSEAKSDSKSESKGESKSEGSEAKTESKSSSESKESKTESNPAPAAKPD